MPAKPQGSLIRCGLIRRLAIMLYDALIVLGLMMLASMAAMLAGVHDQIALRDPVYTLYLVFVWYLYVAGCWRLAGMTVGMRAWRTRIEDEAGGLPDWKKCTVRFTVSILSAGLAGAGFLWSLVDERKRTWHDILSRTNLVRY